MPVTFMSNGLRDFSCLGCGVGWSATDKHWPRPRSCS
jgi:hypothetical protein